MKHVIVYPAGAHGMFLAVLLNKLSGVEVTNLVNMTYDCAEYAEQKFFAIRGAQHFTWDQRKEHTIVNIRIAPSSYLKYLAVCFNRVNDSDLLLEELDQDTYTKLDSHDMAQHFTSSLRVISGQDSGNVEVKFLREWARLCLFSNNGESIKGYVAGTRLDYANYAYDFECFYDPNTVIAECKEILASMNIPVVGSADDLLTKFYANNRYKNIEVATNQVIDAIKNKQDILINLNFLQEAYVDTWLADTYGIDPLLQNEYPATTGQLISVYNL
jgi:hypothetical protein